MGPLLALAAFALYVRTLAPGLLPGDSAEFQMAAWLGGLAHPTGYPLYLILGWLWTHILPLRSPAYRMNLFSAFWSAATVGLLYLLLLRVGKRVARPAARWPTLIAVLLALTFAVTPTFWSQATRTEVYALNSFLITSLLLLCLAKDEPTQDSKDTFPWCALVFGLGLAHHRTILLFAPALLVHHLLTVQWKGARQLLLPISAIALPQLLYLYIPLRADRTPYLHLSLAAGHDLTLYENTLSGFFAMVSGSVFRGSIGSPAAGVGRLSMAVGYLNSQFTPFGVALGLLGVAVLVGRREWPLLALTGLGFLGIVGFGLVYFIGDVFDLFVPAYILWMVWMSIALNFLASVLRGQRVWGLLALTAILPVFLLVTGFHTLDRSHDRATRRRWETLLAEPIPKGALLISNDRDEMVPLWYLQYVDGKRVDLTGLFPLITSAPEHANVARLIDGVLPLGRPLFLIKQMPGLDIKYRLAPTGDRLVHVLGPRSDGDGLTIVSIPLDRSVALRGWTTRPSAPSAGDVLTVTLKWEALAPLSSDYSSYVHLVGPDGKTIAQSDHRPGGAFYPTSLWETGEVLWDDHPVHLPETMPDGPYVLRAGMYLLPTMKRLGKEIVLGKID
jgi:hypothetical protein